MDQWEKNFYITALAGANNGSSLVVMSRGNMIVSWAQENSLACMLNTVIWYCFSGTWELPALLEI